MGLPLLEMNGQANRQRKDLFSAQWNSGKNIKGVVRHSVTSQRTSTTALEIRAAICSSRLKHLRFERFQENEREWYFPRHADGKRKQSSVQLPPSKQKSTPKKFQEIKVYRSFMEENEAKDLKRSKNLVASGKKYTSQAISSKTEGKTSEAGSEAGNSSRVTHPNHAVRRYALYRGMLCQ